MVFSMTQNGKCKLFPTPAGKFPAISESMSIIASGYQSSGRYTASTVSVMNIHWCLQHGVRNFTAIMFVIYLTSGTLQSGERGVCPSIYRPQVWVGDLLNHRQACWALLAQRSDTKTMVPLASAAKMTFGLTISVRITGQKLVRLWGDNRQRRTRIQRKTSLWTMGDETLRKMSTNFSCMVGSWVKKPFFSPENITNANLRKFKDRRSISYSLLVKIFAEGALANFPIHNVNQNKFWRSSVCTYRGVRVMLLYQYHRGF